MTTDKLDQTKIIVIDDRDEVLRLVVSILKFGRYQVIAARSAEQALEVITPFEDTTKLAVIDVRMPRMPGTELALLLYKRCPSIRFVFMSGTPLDLLPAHLREQIEQLPPDSFAFAVKPFGPDLLLANIRFLLNT